MSDLLIGVLGFAAALALGALVAYLILAAKKQRQQSRAKEKQHRQWRHQQLLSSLGTLDAGLTNLTTAALRGSEQFEQERAAGLAQATHAANRSGDDELCRLVETVVARCDTLGMAVQEEREEEYLDLSVRQLGEAQHKVYRRMEVLLDQAFD